MPQQLKYVAQNAMDIYFQNYKGETDFWELEDFITMCGNTIADMYSDVYEQDYAMIRQEKKDEVVTFDVGWLVEQFADVKDEKGILSAILEFPVMTFKYDKSSVGVQNVFCQEPYSDTEMERTTLGAKWQLNYTPKVNRMWFYADVSNFSSKIGIINKGNGNVKKIRVLYVPVMNNEDAWVADGIIADAIAKTILTMRQEENGNVIDKTNDYNSNKVLQTELDKNTLVR